MKKTGPGQGEAADGVPSPGLLPTLPHLTTGEGAWRAHSLPRSQRVQRTRLSRQAAQRVAESAVGRVRVGGPVRARLSSAAGRRSRWETQPGLQTMPTGREPRLHRAAPRKRGLSLHVRPASRCSIRTLSGERTVIPASNRFISGLRKRRTASYGSIGQLHDATRPRLQAREQTLHRCGLALQESDSRRNRELSLHGCGQALHARAPRLHGRGLPLHAPIWSDSPRFGVPPAAGESFRPRSPAYDPAPWLA